MALRRVLPSRATPEKAPEGAATNVSTQAGGFRDNSPAKKPDPAKPFGDAALPEPVSPLVSPSGAFAAAATSAFSTLPTATKPEEPATSSTKPARMLEDSFVKSAVTEPVAEITPKSELKPEPARNPKPPVETEPEPVVEIMPESKPELAPQSPTAAPVHQEPAWAPPSDATFTASAWDEPAAVPSSDTENTPDPELKSVPVASAPEKTTPPEFKPATKPESKPDPVALAIPAPAPAAIAPSPVMAAPMPPVGSPAPAPAPEPQPEARPDASPEPQPEPEAPAAQPDLTPSRPDNTMIRRRVRDKRPRDFNAMGAPENAAPERPRPMTNFAPSVPVDNKPLDQVDASLIATGIMAPKPLDSLTGNLPSSGAEMTFERPLLQPEPATLAPAPMLPPAPAPAPVQPPRTELPPREPETPVPAIIAAPAPAVAPIVIAPPTPAVLTPAPVATAPAAPVRESLPAPAATQPVTFNLSNSAAVVASSQLPPPTSDLPWTKPQTSTEWEIEAPETSGWSPETGHDNAASSPAAAHMPSATADLYKPMGATSSAPLPPLGNVGGAPNLPPRSGGHFTPELPGQRRTSQGGAPWAIIAIGALAVAAGGGWYVFKGKGDQAQQQLATLTTPSATSQNPAGLPGDILAPPRTENAGFYTPPSLNPTTPEGISSSSVVNFADVPPEQASQPIVADGKEEIPSDLNLFGKIKSEVEKARARKAAGLPEDPSASIPLLATADAGTAGAYSKPKLDEELAAYRSALAQSPNPSELKPATFFKDPDGYMDGKTQNQPGQSAGTAVAATGSANLASGALLPPPSASGSVLPPPDLYTNNPNNLPVVAEPLANAPQRVRTLADFPDIEPYAPEKEKVEIPKNLKPKLAATDFPALEVLSFVPGKGLVAFSDGREGVLLIGESINGWELVNVAADRAEFKTGEKSYQVTADN